MTVIFVLTHLFEAAHYTPALVAIALVAIATLVARIVTKSLLPSIVLHATYNLGLVVHLYAGLAASH